VVATPYPVRVTQTVAGPTAGPTTAAVRRLSLRAQIERLAGSDRFWGWAAPLLVTVIGGLLRFRHLDRPHKMIFDEVYYVKQGVSYLKVGYELTVKPSPSKSPDLFTQGHIDIFGTDADRVVHPPVGKWMIAAGEWLFGPQSSWGWRFSAAVVGTLAILMIGRIARRMFGSTLLGAAASVLLAVDGQEFVHSRTGILDIFVMFWALAGFGCLVVDRDQARARLASRMAMPGANLKYGPGLGIRWWRIAGVACLGLDTGVKWSGLYLTAVFLVMSVLWDFSARRAAGVERWFLGSLLRDGLPAFVLAIVLYPAVYLASWGGWFATSGGWDRQWGAEHPAEAGWAWVPDALRGLLHYHADMWQFHLALTSPHPYQANPWAWLVLGRPTLFFYDTHYNGHAGCHVTQCTQAITSLGNPAIWWGATIGVFVLLFRYVLARDWRAGAALSGIVGGYLPWFLYQQRTIFEFYAVAFVPWVVLTVTYCLGLVLGPPGVLDRSRQVRTVVAGSYVLIAVLLFWFFFPVLDGRTIPHAGIDLREWIPSWF
jgi:dolichyl-phosphate-mannose-protein mannosyltransferase